MAEELELLIRFWEAKLKFDQFLVEPSTVVSVEATIRYLKKFQGGSNGSKKSTGIGERNSEDTGAIL